ncbi:hypothetical protein [Fusobacterium gastrosuis]|uniref:hypothetical protein n=1 Tax=Fusobacterium gastrosuis TaxID=1755100 RepID=UPI002974ACAD|nr:hypothetical protein [Fusobacteriaceae bacterium]MDY5712864.1 hypothetical protein [Fusobacterium gastrosuis]
MLYIKKNEVFIILMQDNREYYNYCSHLVLGVMLILGIMPPIFMILEAQIIHFIFSIIIYLCIRIKNNKIPKKIFINLTKEKIEIKKKKQVFTLSYESIKEIVTIEEKGEACLKILTNDGIYEIETIFREDAEIMKKIILEQRKELNEF